MLSILATEALIAPPPEGQPTNVISEEMARDITFGDDDGGLRG